MKVIKPLSLAILHRSYSDGERDLLAVTGVILLPFSGSLPVAEPALWTFVGEQLGKNAILDAGMPKISAEFLVAGRCHAPGGQPVAQMPVRVKVGEREKKLAIVGNRHWAHVRGQWEISSPPEPFAELDIDYAHAFGGTQFARNPLGKGMPPKDEGGPWPLPNVYAPAAPIVAIEDRPEPAGFAPLDLTWPQRFSLAGTYDDHWRETRFPGFAADMDWRIFNTAPPDQWLPGFLRGDEPIEIDGMHPTQASQRAALPGYAARCFITEQTSGASAFREVAMRAETLWLFPNAAHLALIYRGATPIASDDASSVLHLVAGLEALGAPKPATHYADVLARRLDKRRGAAHALDEAPLLPEQLKDVEPPLSAALSERPQPQGFMAANQRRKAEKELEHAKEKLKAQREQLLETARRHRLPPPDLSAIDQALARTLPPVKPAPRIDQLPQVLDEAEKMMADAKAEAIVKKTEAMAKKAEAERSLRALCEKQGLDYDAVSKPKAPRRFKAADMLAQLQATDAAIQKATGAGNPDIARMLADPKLMQKLEQAEQKTLEAYRRNAQHAPPSEAGAQSQLLREQVVAGRARGASFAGQDLTGADLSGLDLANADFSNALMENANLAKTCLAGARLGGALLAHAALEGADLGKADLSGANLGKAHMAGARAQGANFSRAILDEADLAGADLSEAQLDDASLNSARLDGATFARVSAAKLKFIDVAGASGGDVEDGTSPADRPGMDLSGLDFSGAKLDGALFLNARLDRARLAGASLAKATLLGGSAKGADFSGANLTGLRAVRGSQLQGANFSGADLSHANLRGIALDQVDLTGACLEQADLSEASLQEAVLTGADAAGLRAVKADFSRARLTDIDLHGAVLQKAQLAGADVRGGNLHRADLIKLRRDADTLLDGANLGRTLLAGKGP